MNGNSERENKADLIKLAGAFLLLILGVGANLYFAKINPALRFSAWLVLSIVVLGIVYCTAYGRAFWVFLQQSWIELQRVVWPTREETVKVTMAVVAIVALVSLVLWGIDSILLLIMGLLTGQRG